MTEPTYSMRVVTRMTGLTADTIRKWESRHGAIAPGRSAGNTRRYSASDVRRLGMLAELTARGHRIGDLASLPDAEIERLVDSDGVPIPRLGDASRPEEHMRREYLEAVCAYDTMKAADVLARVVATVRVEDLPHRFLLPVLRETGERWASGEMSVGQEHLVSSQLRGLMTLLLQMRPSRGRGPKIVVTTPSGHRHELGAMIAALLVSAHGFEPVYLGPDLPAADMIQAARESRAEMVMLSVIREVDAVERRELASTLKKVASVVPVWVGLPRGHSLGAAKTEARTFNRFEDMELALEGI